MSLLHTFFKLILTSSFSGFPLLSYALLNALLHYVLANLINASDNTLDAYGINSFLFVHFAYFSLSSDFVCLANLLFNLSVIYVNANSNADVFASVETSNLYSNNFDVSSSCAGSDFFLLRSIAEI